MNLDAYFARIGYDGPRAATIETLHALTSAHALAIPFENLDVILGRGVALEPDALFEKLVVQRRGGYCFEQNGLFLIALEALGFFVQPLSARVRLLRPRDFTPPRTHVFVRVDLGGEGWLTDVGVGAASLTGALRFDSALEQPTPHETRRLITDNGVRYHQVKYGDSWSDVYEFTGETMPMIDRVVGNWFTSTHPHSHFRDKLMVAKALPDGRRATLLNREFTLRARDGRAETRTLASPRELVDTLASQFGLGPFREDELTAFKPIGF